MKFGGKIDNIQTASRNINWYGIYWREFHPKCVNDLYRNVSKTGHCFSNSASYKYF